MRPLLLLPLSAALLAGFAHAADKVPAATPYATLIPGGTLPDAGRAARSEAAAKAEAAPALPGMTDVAPPPPSAAASANQQSEVFGAQLFTGAFSRQGAAQFNPDYQIAVGDRVQVRLWGAFEADSGYTVDPQGNIFLPHLGPVKLAGVKNRDLQGTVEAAVRRVFRANVYCYAALAGAQPVRVFVSGFVRRPGLYGGTSMDSLIQYLDQAGGIDPDRGSFLAVQIKRGSQVRATVNLYDFLLDGRLTGAQLTDGDVIFVPPRQHTLRVSGLAENARRFEFAPGHYSVADLVRLAKPRPEATHARVIRNTGATRNVEYYPLAEASRVALTDGDEVEFTADKKPGTITVRVEGEHLSAQEYVLPWGARLGELLRRIEFNERSDAQSTQLFRQSVKERQKKMLTTALRNFEAAVLTARSGTSDEARLRSEEADLLLKWVDRATKVEPSGQVQIGQATARDDLLLENGDVLKVPVKDGLVLVSGEVLFPNAIAWDARLGATEYIHRAGGFSQNPDGSRIILAHRDGSFADVSPGSRQGDNTVRPGDEILVLPKVDVKSRQIWKDMTQILYQIAVSAKVVLGL